MFKNYDSNLVRCEGAVKLPHFKNIRKNTISETYQYFIKLIKGKSIENLNECLSLNTELSLFDESLQLLLIDYLQLEGEVLKILLSQNENQIKRILRCKWFFQKLPAEICTKQIFPYISVSLRCKIINRLSKYLESTEEAEKYFAFIRANYDNKRANYILPRCSFKFILAYVEHSKPTFNYNTGLRVLLNISKRYPELGVHILSIIFDLKNESHHSFDPYRRVMKYLAGYHSNLMVPFIKKYNLKIPLHLFGQKLTKKVAAKLREDLFPDLMKHLIFKERTLFSILCFEEKVKCIAAFVQFCSDNLNVNSWFRSSGRISELLKLVPQEKRLAIIQASFEKVYNLNFDDHSRFWCPKLFELLPTDTRLPYVTKLEKFLDSHAEDLEKSVNCDLFSPDVPEAIYYLYDSKCAFEKLKELLRKTPAVNRRKNILLHLVKSCSINKDVEALQEISEYVATCHRNDDHGVIFGFIDAICDHFPASALNSTIYEKLEDLAYFCSLKSRRNDYIYNRFRERHIYYRLENNMDVDVHVKNFFDSAILNSSYAYTFVGDFKSENSKVLVLALCKMTVDWIKSNSSDSNSNTTAALLTKVLDTCKEYNKLNKRTRLFLQDIPGLKDLLKEKLKANFGGIVEYSWLNICEKFYGDVLNSYYKPKCLLFAFNQKPELIKQYLEDILKILCSDYLRVLNSFFIFLMKKASFFGETEKVKEILLNEFKTGELIHRRKTALRLYSRVCTIEEYTKAIEDFLPHREKIEQNSDEGFDEIQILIPSLIKHVRPRWKNFELIFKFFVGDFLKSVLPSLYSCCFHTRSDVAVPVLKKQLNTLPPKVSYVKDIIRLIFELSDRSGRSDFYLDLWKEYKHYTVRCIVLGYISRSFLEQPTRDSFQVLLSCILDCDEMTISEKPDLQKVPDEFLNDYVSALWRFSDGQKPVFRNSFRQKLLRYFNVSNISVLSLELCEAIIKNNLFNPPLGTAIDEFAVVYLSAQPETAEEKVFMVLDLIKDRRPKAASVHNFFNILITKSHGRSPDFADIFKIILNNWPEYPLGVLQEQRVLMTYHDLHQNVLRRCENPEGAPAELGKELNKLFSTVDDLNDLLIIYVEALKLFFANFQILDVILTIRELVEGSRDRAVDVIAILCLPKKAVVWLNEEDDLIVGKAAKGKEVLKEIVEVLEKRGDDVVLIYLRSKFEFVK